MAQNAIVKKFTNAFPGILLILLMAGVLTYGGSTVVAEATKPKPAATKTVSVDQKASAEAKSEDAGGSVSSEGGAAVSSNGSSASTSASSSTAGTSSSSSASSTPAAEPNQKTATTTGDVKFRSSPTTSILTNIIRTVSADTTVTIVGDPVGGFQRVSVNGQTGYIATSYLKFN